MARRQPLRPHETTWEDWLLGGGARACFGDPDLPLEVEIGPGDDDFLLQSALADAGTNWLGIEYSRKRVRRQVRRAQRQGVPLENLRFIWRPAADLVGPFLCPAAVAAYHVYFPDPWPKAHHARYRLLAPAFAADLAGSLVPGGRVDLATDDEAYAEAIREAFGAVETLEEVPAGDVERHLEESTTVFADRWRSLGRKIHVLRFVKPRAE